MSAAPVVAPWTTYQNQARSGTELKGFVGVIELSYDYQTVYVGGMVKDALNYQMSMVGVSAFTGAILWKQKRTRNNDQVEQDIPTVIHKPTVVRDNGEWIYTCGQMSIPKSGLSNGYLTGTRLTSAGIAMQYSLTINTF